MRVNRVAAGLLAFVWLQATPASALSFAFTVVSGDTLTNDQYNAFSTAANAWSSYLSDSITVNLQIGFRSLSTGVLGSTSSSFVATSTGALRTALAGDITSLDDSRAVASLASATATGIVLTSAQARAAGFSTAQGSDGTIEFSSNFAFSTSRAADGGIAADTYDLIGVAEHEIGHVLGFDSSIDGSFGGRQSVLDQFRYSAAGVRSVSAGATAYFSIDNGTTDIANFSPGGTGNYQASHWDANISALMMPALAPGRRQDITELDLRALDVIGYDRIVVPPLAPVPEPASWAMMIAGFGLVGTAMRRRQMTVRFARAVRTT